MKERRYYIKEITGCRGCPCFCDEGEFCHHPDWRYEKHLHVVNMYDKDGKFIEDFTFPLDCPLQTIRHNEGEELRLVTIKWGSPFLPL